MFHYKIISHKAQIKSYRTIKCHKLEATIEEFTATETLHPNKTILTREKEVTIQLIPPYCVKSDNERTNLTIKRQKYLT